jgi:hypothetical protein
MRGVKQTMDERRGPQSIAESLQSLSELLKQFTKFLDGTTDEATKLKKRIDHFMSLFKAIGLLVGFLYVLAIWINRIYFPSPQWLISFTCLVMIAGGHYFFFRNIERLKGESLLQLLDEKHRSLFLLKTAGPATIFFFGTSLALFIGCIDIYFGVYSPGILNLLIGLSGIFGLSIGAVVLFSLELVRISFAYEKIVFLAESINVFASETVEVSKFVNENADLLCRMGNVVLPELLKDREMPKTDQTDPSS